MSLVDLTYQLETLSDPDDAKNLARYFKTGPGDYGAGDRFRGIRVPTLRRVVRNQRMLPHEDVLMLLQSAYHEDRLTGLLIWVEQVRKGDADKRQAILEAYLANTDRINNWDLVDQSAPSIVGLCLYDTVVHDGPSDILTGLAQSTVLWERRIAIMATFYFIKHDHFAETLRVADLLLHDEHDLIHKAVGWMLREVGNVERSREEAFLQSRYQSMPRTTLRYAIEKFPKAQRQAYLQGEI
jgi:3-methyladenine DNA glycosylase AlkD